MADIFPCDDRFLVKPAQNGMYAQWGNTSDENPSGAWMLYFRPSLDFAGEFIVSGRPPRIQTSDTSVPFLPIPYRRVTLNNVASDYAMVDDAVSGASIVHIPANGISVALLINCTAGSCMVYAQKMEGATTP